MKRHRKKIFIGIAALLVLLLGAFLLAPKEDFSTTSNIFRTIKSKIESEYSNLHVSDESEWLAQMTSGLPDSVEGYEFKVNSQSAPTITVGFGDTAPDSRTSTNSLSDVQPIIDSVMSRAGFVKSPGKGNIFYDKPPVTTCVLINNNGLLTLSCSTKDILKAQAEAAKPLVDAYMAAKPGTVAADLGIGPVVFKDESHAGHVFTASRTDGYRIAEAVINARDSKKVVLFYQKDGGNWTYASEADDEYGFLCGNFNANPEARKAFYDQVCLGPEGHVRLDTDNRALQ